MLGFFNINVPVIHDSGWLGIAFSLFVVVVAALNLVLDFDFIETGVAQRAEVYGVVWRIRPGDPGLAICGVPAPAVEDPAALNRIEP